MHFKIDPIRIPRANYRYFDRNTGNEVTEEQVLDLLRNPRQEHQRKKLCKLIYKIPTRVKPKILEIVEHEVSGTPKILRIVEDEESGTDSNQKSNLCSRLCSIFNKNSKVDSSDDNYFFYSNETTSENINDDLEKKDSISRKKKKYKKKKKWGPGEYTKYQQQKYQQQKNKKTTIIDYYDSSGESNESEQENNKKTSIIDLESLNNDSFYSYENLDDFNSKYKDYEQLDY